MKNTPNSIRVLVPRVRPIAGLIAGCLLLCALVVPARAADIGDVFNIVDRTENKVDLIRDRVNEIRNDTLPVITSIVTDTQTRVGTTGSNVVSTAAEVLDVKGRVQSIQTKVLDIGTNNTEFLLQMRAGVGALAGNAQALVDETVADVQQFVDQQLDGRDDFVNNHAAQFRAEILALLTSIEGLINTLSDMTGTNITLDFSRERILLSTIPDRHLYPLYRVFQAIDLAKMANALSDIFSNLNLVRQVFEADVAGSGSGSGFAPGAGIGVPDACQLILQNPDGLKNALKVISKLESGALRLNAKIMHAVGDKAADAEITVGLWGFVLTKLTVNIPYTISTTFDGIADAIEKVYKVVEKKIDKCEELSRHDQILTRLDNIKTNQITQLRSDLADLNTLVSSRSSQSSVDTLGTTVSSRASQAGLDVLTTKVDTHQSSALRLQVELQLSDNTRHPSMLFLPEAHGGKLGFVRSVVAETLATNVAAGLYSGTLAGEELQKGDAAAATNDYRGAFDSYRRAYQEITKWPVTASIESDNAVGAVDLIWPSDRGGIYCVEFSTDLARWNVLLPKVIGDSGQTEVPLTASGGAGFYRVYRLSSYDPAANRI